MSGSLEDCEAGCVECHAFKKGSEQKFECVEKNEPAKWKFGNKCGRFRDRSRCHMKERCFWSYPADDVMRWKSLEGTCRTVPLDYMEDDFVFQKRPANARNQKHGLCWAGCPEG